MKLGSSRIPASGLVGGLVGRLVGGLVGRLVGGLVEAELAVAMTARSLDGEAHKAAIADLAKVFKVAKSRRTIVKGATFRSKVVEISLAPQAREEVERD